MLQYAHRMHIGRQETDIISGKKAIHGSLHHTNQGEVASYRSLGRPQSFSLRNPSRNTLRKGQLIPFATEIITNNQLLLKQLINQLNSELDPSRSVLIIFSVY